MPVIPSAIIAAETPATKEQLWELRFLFACDWSNGITISSRYTTDIIKTVDDNEQRFGLVSSPYRLLSARLKIRGAANMSRARNMLMRAGIARHLVPIFTDECISGDLFQLLSKRFCVGAYVAFVRFNANRTEVEELAVSTISGIPNDNNLESPGVPGWFGLGDSFFPLMECELTLEQTLDVVTDELLELNLEAEESVGDHSLLPFANIGDYADQFEGFPILNADFEFGQRLQVGVIRTGGYTNAGRGKSLEVFGTRPRWSYQLSHVADSRLAAKNLTKFFESVGGRLKPFYLASPLNDLNVTAIDATTITVEATGPELDWSFYTHVALMIERESTNNVAYEVVLREILNVTRVGSEDVIEIDALVVVPTLGNLFRLSFAHKVRFDSDEMQENWTTNGVMSTSFACIEVLNDENISIPNLIDLNS